MKVRYAIIHWRDAAGGAGWRDDVIESSIIVSIGIIIAETEHDVTLTLSECFTDHVRFGAQMCIPKRAILHRKNLTQKLKRRK